MGRSTSAYLQAAGDVRSVKQIRVIAEAICEDLAVSSHLRRKSSALVRKLDRIIDLPIASAAYLARIWQDFGDLHALLEQDHNKLNPLLAPDVAGRCVRTRKSKLNRRAKTGGTRVP